MPKTKGDGAVTDAELANLSDEEREALEGDDTTDAAALKQLAAEGDGEGDEAGDKAGDKGAEKDKKKPAAAEDDDDDDDDDAGKGADKDAKAGAKADDKADAKSEKAEKAAAADAAAGAGEGEGEADDDDPEPQFPRYTAPPVEKYDEKIAALDARQAEAEAKFKAGDLELDALRAEDRKIEGERRTLQEAKLKHDISVEQTNQSDAQKWQYDIARFMREAKKSDGIDYSGNRTLNAALDQTVKDLANAKDKDGKLINDEKSGRWFLREAHKQVMKDIGRKPAAAADDAAETPAQKKAAAAAARKTDPKKLPQTLAKVPAADSAGDGDDPEFGHLEGLDGLDLEDAVARMTPAQQDKWARSSAVA